MKGWSRSFHCFRIPQTKNSSAGKSAKELEGWQGGVSSSVPWAAAGAAHNLHTAASLGGAVSAQALGEALPLALSLSTPICPCRSAPALPAVPPHGQPAPGLRGGGTCPGEVIHPCGHSRVAVTIPAQRFQSQGQEVLGWKPNSLPWQHQGGSWEQAGSGGIWHAGCRCRSWGALGPPCGLGPARGTASCRCPSLSTSAPGASAVPWGCTKASLGQDQGWPGTSCASRPGLCSASRGGGHLARIPAAAEDRQDAAGGGPWPSSSLRRRRRSCPRQEDTSHRAPAPASSFPAKEA